MAQANVVSERRTSVDDVFDHLHEQILTLQLKPGDRISEADIAAQFGVSRQPVRDAFSRLANLDLLLIRPQRATEVRRFSRRQIERARFVRAAVEAEVLRRAATHCDATGAEVLDTCLEQQEIASLAKDVERFGQLDYEFHEVLCRIAQAEYVFEVIMVEKSKIDRLCLLGIEKEQRIPDLVEDHRAIAAAVKALDPDKAVEVGMRHLSRIDETIRRISATNANFFDNADN